MPHIDGAYYTPDDALELGRCPECGDPLAGKNVRAHSLLHWPEFLAAIPQHDEARRRKAMLEGYQGGGR